MTAALTPGRAFVFGDNIDTDLLAPGHLMKLAPEELAKYCLSALDPQFAVAVKAGDFLVAGSNFGLGSSREQAAVSLKLLGVKAIIACGFARIFYRNALNLGLPTLFCESARTIASGDLLRVDPIAGLIENITQGSELTCTPIPAHLMEMVNAGGLIEDLKSTRVAKR